jgi:hypothetical protein
VNYNITYAFEAFTTIRDALDWWAVHRLIAARRAELIAAHVARFR